MAHKFINEINPGETVDDIYMLKDPVLRSTTRGDLYIAAFVCDKTGQINGRMWQATESVYKSLSNGGFVHINGRSELYQNQLQVIINNATVVDTSDVKLDDFLNRTDKDVNKLFEEIRDVLKKVKNEQLKAIINEFLADEDLMIRFRKAPAATAIHHNYIGGLIEHTHNMLRVALAILDFYPRLQKDLVLTGVFLHDMGKTEELSYDTSFSYTDSGQLLGHISKGLVMLNRKADMLAASGKQINEEIFAALGHIILSHHGQYEFGSPKLPATAEAFMVNLLDEIDAKMNQVTSLADNDLSESNWTAWQRSIGTHVYKKRIED